MDVVELLTTVRLKDVRTLDEVAQLKADGSPGQGLGTLDESHSESELVMEINPIVWGTRIEIWVRAWFETQAVKLVASVATVYERETDEYVPEPTRTEFIEKVAVMAAYPYLRSALQGLAATMRLGEFTLDILRQGEFHMGTSEATDSAQ